MKARRERPHWGEDDGPDKVERGNRLNRGRLTHAAQERTRLGGQLIDSGILNAR